MLLVAVVDGVADVLVCVGELHETFINAGVAERLLTPDRGKGTLVRD